MSWLIPPQWVVVFFIAESVPNAQGLVFAKENRKGNSLQPRVIVQMAR
jgi:hypothetical protein